MVFNIESFELFSSQWFIVILVNGVLFKGRSLINLVRFIEIIPIEKDFSKELEYFIMHFFERPVLVDPHQAGNVNLLQ